MADDRRHGWFADLADEEDRATAPSHPWQPFLQLDGECLGLPAWFRTEQECERFIRDEVIGQGMLDDAPDGGT